MITFRRNQSIMNTTSTVMRPSIIGTSHGLPGKRLGAAACRRGVVQELGMDMLLCIWKHTLPSAMLLVAFMIAMLVSPIGSTVGPIPSNTGAVKRNIEAVPPIPVMMMMSHPGVVLNTIGVVATFRRVVLPPPCQL